MISKEYLASLTDLHKNKAFGAKGKLPKEVVSLIESGDVKSVLDFGCGKGAATAAMKEHYPEIKLYSYDPVTSPIDLPTSVDLIFSTDVLEHVEPELLDVTLLDLFSRANKYQYHLIACHPAKKHLSDGRNAHLIIENPDWWKEKIIKTGWKIESEKIAQYERVLKKTKKHLVIDVVKYIVLLSKPEL